jgi:hypothetical protein
MEYDPWEQYLVSRLGKVDDEMKIHLQSELKNRLFRLAEMDGRSLSEYCRRVLTLHACGHYEVVTAQKEGNNRDGEGT